VLYILIRPINLLKFSFFLFFDSESRGHAAGVTNVNPKVSPEDKNYNRHQKINPGDTGDKYDSLTILLDLHR
jgi:hypothetical protein